MTLAELIAQKVREALGQAIEDKKGTLEDIAKAGGKEAAHDIVGDVGTIVDLVLFALAALSIETPGVSEGIGLLEGAKKASGPIGSDIGIGYFSAYAAWQFMQPLLLPVEHAVASAVTNEIFDMDTAAQLAQRGLMTEGHAADEASGSGFDEDHLRHAMALHAARLTPTELLELHRRGLVDNTTFAEHMHHLGYYPDDTLRMAALSRQLLSPADLALAHLRTFLNAEQMYAYAKELGVTKPDMDVLVNNTGEPPGPMELLFAYRRGFIDKPRLERGIRQSRIRDEWIDVMEKLRFSPMSTADSVRAVVEGHIPEGEGQKIAEQNGLEPNHYDILVKAWGRPLAHGQMLELYHRGLASRKQVDAALRESDIKNKYSDQSFELGRRLIPERLLVQAIQHGAMSLQEGARRFMEWGYNKEDTNILLHLGLNQRKTTVKTLTKAEIIQAFGEHLMSEAEVMSHLEKLGYSKTDAAMEVKLEQSKQSAAELRTAVAHVRDAFLTGRIRPEAAENDLASLGVDRVQARHLISVWTKEGKHATKLLTSAQIAKAVKEKVITAENARDRLVALGYTLSDANILITETVRAAGG